MATYFLTGATGVVGSAVLSRLLAEPENEITLLLRSRADQSVAQRVNDLIGDSIPDRDVLSRITVVEGDIEAESFGMESSQYDHLARTVERIIHCAGNVKSNLPHEKARSIAVGSVECLIDLARRSKDQGVLEKVEVVSTIGVAGCDTSPVNEIRLDSGRQFHNSYEHAKAMAEDVAWAGVEEGLPITIHRPSMIVGDSISGSVRAFQVFYYICDFLSGSQTKGLLPRFGSAALDVVPVDFVARAIHWSSGRTETTGKALHLTCGAERSLRMGELMALVAASYSRNGVALPRVWQLPRFVFANLIPALRALAPERTKRRISTLGFFLDYLNQPTNFCSAETDKLLARYQITKPQNFDYIGRVLDYYLQHR